MFKYTPTVPRVLLKKYFSILYRLPQSKHRERKTEFCIPLIFMGHSMALNSLYNHLKVTFKQTLYWYAYSISYTLVQ